MLRLEINGNIGRPDGYQITNLNVRKLRTSAILVTPQLYLPGLGLSYQIDYQVKRLLIEDLAL